MQIVRLTELIKRLGKAETVFGDAFERIRTTLWRGRHVQQLFSGVPAP